MDHLCGGGRAAAVLRFFRQNVYFRTADHRAGLLRCSHPLIGAALRPQRQGIYPATILEAEDDAAAADVLPEDLPIPTIDQLISRQRAGSQLPPMPTRQQPPPLPHRDR